MELFRRLHADGQTILLVTHDDDVAAAADRIAQMRDGHVVDDTVRQPARASTLFGPVLQAPRGSSEG